MDNYDSLNGKNAELRDDIAGCILDYAGYDDEGNLVIPDTTTGFRNMIFDLVVMYRNRKKKMKMTAGEKKEIIEDVLPDFAQGVRTEVDGDTSAIFEADFPYLAEKIVEELEFYEEK